MGGSFDGSSFEKALVELEDAAAGNSAAPAAELESKEGSEHGPQQQQQQQLEEAQPKSAILQSAGEGRGEERGAGRLAAVQAPAGSA